MDRRRVLTGAAALAAAAMVERPGRLWAAGAAAAPVVETSHGPVRGYWAGSAATPVAAFKGIPYGLDTARTRFAAPAPPQRWTTVRECVAWAGRAPQTVGARPEYESARARAAAAVAPGYHLPPDEGEQTEDCLHLNLWAPAARHRVGSGPARPVLFYIHGGAFANGTANAALYDGARLAERHGCVLVAVNHRLNSFGYAFFAELLPGLGLEDSGNAGQLDLVLALEWVRENIARFGGDAQRVMIFGQSGGGAKCATLMAQPPAAGMFQRVLTMSGQQVVGVRPEHATERARKLLSNLGLDANDPVASGRGLRSRPMSEIQQATRTAGYFGPVRDGRSLPVDPFSPTDPKLSAAIPMVLGNTRDETRVLIGGGHPEYFALSWSTLPAALERDAPFLRSPVGEAVPQVALPVEEVIARYRAWHPAYSASELFFAITTDSRSWRGEVIEAEARARDPQAQPHTWVYQLDWASPIDGGRWGAPHTLDLALAFDNVALAPGMVGSSAADQQRAQRMADRVSAFFVQFARTGDPNGAGAPRWPAFDLARRPTLIVDDPLRIEDDPRGAERRYLGQVPYVQPGS